MFVSSKGQVSKIIIEGEGLQIDSYPIGDLMNLGKTPITIDVLASMLQNYPTKIDKQILAEGFLVGFNVGYEGPRIPTNCRNLASTYIHENPLEQKLKKKLKLGRIAGPFSYRSLENLRISTIGLVPKKSGVWRLMHNLSYPLGNSVNSHIDPECNTVQYTSFDKVLDTISDCGPLSLMGRMDISSAFRLFIINPGEFELFGFKFKDNCYFDKCLPMCCFASCQLFEKNATFLEWSVKNRSRNAPIEHYLDDFFFVGKANSLECKGLMSVFSTVCDELGVPLAAEKTIGPATVIIFLGLEIDTKEMVVKILMETMTETKEKLAFVLNSKKVILRTLQSMIGLLNFCARAIPPVRAFNRRFCDATCGVKKTRTI